MILALATGPVAVARQSRLWDFESDPVGSSPAGWVVRNQVADFSATVRQEEGNRYLHLESHQDQGCPGITALWGRGTPSPDWVYAGAVQFRIRFNVVNPLAFVQLRGNLPANGAGNDDCQLLFTGFQPGPAGSQGIGALDPAGFGLPLRQWHTVRIQFRGVRKSLVAEDPYSRGTWRLTVGDHSAAGELGQAGQDLPHGNALNSVSFGKWFDDPVDFDIDDVRVSSDADPNPAAKPVAEPEPAAAVAAAPVAIAPAPAPAPFTPAPAAPPAVVAKEPPPAPPAPAAGGQNVNRFLNSAGGPSVLTGFIRSRVSVDDAGRRTAAVVFEVAQKKPSAQKVPKLMELRPGLWDGTGAVILLKNYNFNREVGELIRVRVVETRAIQNYRTFVVTGEY